MNMKEIIRELVEADGRTQSEISEHMGKSDRWLSCMMTRGNMSVSTLWEILDELGYELKIEGYGKEWTIEGEFEKRKQWIKEDKDKDSYGVRIG